MSFSKLTAKHVADLIEQQPLLGFLLTDTATLDCKSKFTMFLLCVHVLVRDDALFASHVKHFDIDKTLEQTENRIYAQCKQAHSLLRDLIVNCKERAAKHTVALKAFCTAPTDANKQTLCNAMALWIGDTESKNVMEKLTSAVFIDHYNAQKIIPLIRNLEKQLDACEDFYCTL